MVSGLFLLCAMTAAGDAIADVTPPGDTRERLTADVLRHGRQVTDEAIHNGWFMPVGQTAPALHVFSGTLALPETRMAGFDGGDEADGWFPALDIGFVSHGDDLIPVDAGLLRGTGAKSPWQLIVSPGRIWSEPGDNGLSRASFPFVLAGRGWWNEAHNGLATFVFDDRSVSDVRFQIVQETAPFNTFEAYGRLDAVYAPHAIDGATGVIAAFERDRATRLPIRPFDDLHDDLSLDAIRTFAGARADGPVSASGMIVDGVMYLRPCETRYGDFPYCEDMRHGVFSVTKSLGALVAMLHLAQRYGDDVFALKIKDYVNVTARHDGWDDVTFADTLNMASGIGEASPDRGGSDYWAELYPSWKTARFLDAQTASAKLRAAFYGQNYDWGPGEVFRYRNIDTFVLAAAMDSLVKQREGPDAAIWDSVTEAVLHPIGIMTLPLAHTFETDGTPGIPLLAAGLYPNVQDIAKLTTLLQNGGQAGGQQLLSPAMLAQALYQTDVRGLDVPGRDGETYHMALWNLLYRQAGCDVQVPRMSGWGGNIIELLHNGVTTFYLSDDFLHDHRELAEAADEIRPLCPG